MKNAVQAGNALGHIGMMDFTNLKSIEKCGDKLKVYTTGLTKACAAFVFINKNCLTIYDCANELVLKEDFELIKHKGRKTPRGRWSVRKVETSVCLGIG